MISNLTFCHHNYMTLSPAVSNFPFIISVSKVTNHCCLHTCAYLFETCNEFLSLAELPNEKFDWLRCQLRVIGHYELKDHSNQLAALLTVKRQVQLTTSNHGKQREKEGLVWKARKWHCITLMTYNRYFIHRWTMVEFNGSMQIIIVACKHKIRKRLYCFISNFHTFQSSLYIYRRDCSRKTFCGMTLRSLPANLPLKPSSYFSKCSSSSIAMSTPASQWGSDDTQFKFGVSIPIHTGTETNSPNSHGGTEWQTSNDQQRSKQNVVVEGCLNNNRHTHHKAAAQMAYGRCIRNGQL